MAIGRPICISLSLSLRHNLDLYNDTQTEKLIRKIAESLEIGTRVSAAALIELADELEKYRLEELDKQTQTQEKRKQLSTAEIKATQEYLRALNLMGSTMEDIGRVVLMEMDTTWLEQRNLREVQYLAGCPYISSTKLSAKRYGRLTRRSATVPSVGIKSINETKIENENVIFTKSKLKKTWTYELKN
jgi:hypothetical protein